MQTTVKGVQIVEMVHTRPRGPGTGSGRQTTPMDAGSDPFGDTQTRRALVRSAPAAVGIVVTGDNCLSAALPRLSVQRRAERREHLRHGFSTAVDYALEHGARLFVIAGDLFATPSPSNAERAFVASELARLRRANIICVGVSGLHDSPRAHSRPDPEDADVSDESPHHIYAALDGMTYFPASTTLAPRLVALGDLRLAVAGISTDPQAPRGSDPLAQIVLSDADGVLSRAHVGLMIAHAAVEGFARPDEDDRVITRASLDALPPIFRVVVAGHVHRFGRAHVGEREIIVPGSTERMDFDSQPGSSGFAWLEVGPAGLMRVKRITVAEQPRADVELATDVIFPGGAFTAEPAEEERAYPIPALPVLTPNGTYADETDLRALAGNGHAPADVFAPVRAAIDAVATDDTLVRLRLVGPISRGQYHQLPLRQIRQYGAQRAFSFDLDTSGLELIEPAVASASGTLAPAASAVRRAPSPTGPLSPNAEVERLLQERLAQIPATDTAAIADLHAAANILLARLRASGEPQDRFQNRQNRQNRHDREADR